MFQSDLSKSMLVKKRSGDTKSLQEMESVIRELCVEEFQPHTYIDALGRYVTVLKDCSYYEERINDAITVFYNNFPENEHPEIVGLAHY